MMRINKLVRLKRSGSYTIEVSLIMPMVIGVILLILYLSIYVYDKSVFEYAFTKVLAGTYSEAEYDSLSGEAESIIRKEIDNNLIADWETGIEISENDEGISLTIVAKMRHSQGLISSLINDNIFVVKEHIVVPRGHESGLIGK